MGDGYNRYIEIISSTTRNYRKLNATGIRMEMRFKKPDIENIHDWTTKCIDALLKLVEIKLKVASQDRVGLTFSNSENQKIDFNISFRRYDQYTPELVLRSLDSVLQSNTNFLIEDALTIKVDHVRIPIGKGRRTCIGKSNSDFYNIHKNAIFTPEIDESDGNICLASAVLIGKIYADGDICQNLYNRMVYKGNHNEMVTHSKLLATEARVDLENGGGIDEIDKFQQYLQNEYNINVYSSRDGRSVYYKSRHQNRKHINLLLDNGHYSVIKSLTAVFASSYFCSYCAEPYATRLGHRNCPFKCNRCYDSPPCERTVDLQCSDCNRVFVNSLCFQKHIKNKVCLKIRICLTCTKSYSYDKKKKHICGIKYCYLCKSEKPIRHECYIPIVEPKRAKFNKELYVFFDLECTQSTPFPGDNTKFEHKVNLCVVHQSCDTCNTISDISISCSNCSIREHIFDGHDIIEKFMKYLGSIPDHFKHIVVIAHNLQKYDGHFLLQYMYKSIETWPLKEDCLIINGSKILQIKIGRYRFIDSLNFFSVGLAKLPAM